MPKERANSSRSFSPTPPFTTRPALASSSVNSAPGRPYRRWLPLLSDEHLCAYARSGLEGIPDPRAAEALRNAAAKLTGDRLAGVVESLGVLRDPNAVVLLQKLAADPASGVSPQALLALGHIANESVNPDHPGGPGPASGRHTTNAAAACLLAAQRQLADGHADAAAALCDAVRRANVPASFPGGSGLRCHRRPKSGRGAVAG